MRNRCVGIKLDGRRCTHYTDNRSGICNKKHVKKNLIAATPDISTLQLNNVDSVVGMPETQEEPLEKRINRAKQSLNAAQSHIMQTMPYLQNITGTLMPVYTTELETMGVDDAQRLFINPDFINETPEFEVAGCLVHEANHILRNDVEGKPEGLDHKIWNAAADLVINQQIKTIAEVGLPDFVLYPETLGLPSNLSREDYALRLLERQRESPDGSGGGQRQGNKGDEGEGKGVIGSGSCGSCADGDGSSFLTPEMEKAAEEQGIGKGMSKGDVLDQIDRTFRDINDHVDSQGGEPGTIPSDLVIRAQEYATPSKVDWRNVLLADLDGAIRSALGGMRRRNPRRFNLWDPPVVMGRRMPLSDGYSRYTPNISVVMDTSASMGGDEISQALGEAQGILEQNGTAQLQIFSVDVEAHHHPDVQNLIDIELVGGGGTDMRVGIDKALNLPKEDRRFAQPNVVVVATDGYTPWPAFPPDDIGETAVIALLIGPKKHRPPSPPAWIRTVYVDPTNDN